MQVEVGRYSKGSYTIERADKLSLFEFLNEARFYQYLWEIDYALRKKNNI